LIDGDLQNDPADIPAMLKMMETENWDMVAGVRANRKDGMFLRKVPSKIANYMIRRSTGTKMKDLGCTLKIFTKETIKSIHIYGELHRYIPVLIAFEGATRITQVDVNHRPRKFGTSKYNLNRTTKVMSDLFLMLFFKKYLQRPMHFFGGLGIITLGNWVTHQSLHAYPENSWPRYLGKTVAFTWNPFGDGRNSVCYHWNYCRTANANLL
jgi:hypothetical protein